ncbi:flagellar export chaperone FlgN [Photobacterium sp.]|uniref:flagellar export chaperone FlgN n=1 Tax=Photobacterium sp. TaxID=660 RepID=UPI00299DE239|nr:flagellar export chaperone FlgN [Photobacterium sp.]MDX1301103.1 flagellar export chaperone FlgN [Photobacterium sp.]
MNRHQAIKLVIQGIQNDTRHYQLLYRLMVKQQASYIDFNGEALGALTEQQQPLIDQLHKSAQQRSLLMQQLGLSNSKQGITTLFNVLPGQLKQQMNECWYTLEARVRSCQQLNQLNGHISASYSEVLQQLQQEESYGAGQLMQS